MNKTAVTTFALSALMAGSLAACSGGTTTQPPAPATSQAAAPGTTTVQAAPATVPPAPPADTTTPGQKNALAKAGSYLEFQAFSRAGLIKQLQFDKFSADDATYAVDHVTVDWMEQAVKKGKSYLEFQAFSHDGLVKQLVFDGFTPEQAEHGATGAGV